MHKEIVLSVAGAILVTASITSIITESDNVEHGH